MTSNFNRGALVAICGLDGAGKTTQIERVATRLSADYPVYKTRQPTEWFRQLQIVQDFKDKIGDQPELYLAELALLSATDRLRHHRLEVEPQLQAGKLVITDRHVVSTYTSFLASGFKDVAWLRSINRYSLIPDLVVYLDVEPETVVARVRSRPEFKEQEVDVDLVAKTRHYYLSRPWGDDLIPNYQVLDGTLPQEEIERRIIALIERTMSDRHGEPAPSGESEEKQTLNVD